MEMLTERTPAGIGILKKCKTCHRYNTRCPGVCIDQDKANTRLAEYEETCLTPAHIIELNNNAHSNAGGDACAHAIYEGKLRRRPASAYCRHCGTHLETAYHEERLYSVACSECKTVTLVKARNPDEAARIVGEPMPF